MKKILPLSSSPITSYPHYADVFSIIGTQSNHHIPWIYNYFVQLFVPDNIEQGLRIDYVVPDVFIFLPYIETNFISRDIALHKWNGIINFIRDYIEYNYYIYAFFEVSQIAAYTTKHIRYHDMMLYGYDDKEEEIYFSDNYKNGKYTSGVATYEEIINASNNYITIRTSGGQNIKPFRCLRYKENCDPFHFNKDEYIRLLTEYIERKNSNKYWKVPRIYKAEEEKCIYGIGIYTFIRRHICYIQELNKKIDIRGFYVLYEHKTILEKSLTYMMGENWKIKYPEEWEKLKRNINTTNTMLMLCLKYNITLYPSILSKLDQLLINLEKMDEELFPKLIHIIKNT